METEEQKTLRAIREMIADLDLERQWSVLNCHAEIASIRSRYEVNDWVIAVALIGAQLAAIPEKA